MKPYKAWKQITESEMTPEQYAQFWKEYLSEEEKIYKQILNQDPDIAGSIQVLSEKYGVDETTFTGFLDGINPSLTEELDLDNLELDTELNFTINYETLYYNMHVAKAKWLYNINTWETILSKEIRKEIKSKYRSSVMIVKTNKIGRNDPCPCGSGKKYKKCCMLKEAEKL